MASNLRTAAGFQPPPHLQAVEVGEIFYCTKDHNKDVVVVADDNTPCFACTDLHVGQRIIAMDRWNNW